MECFVNHLHYVTSLPSFINIILRTGVRRIKCIIPSPIYSSRKKWDYQRFFYNQFWRNQLLPSRAFKRHFPQNRMKLAWFTPNLFEVNIQFSIIRCFLSIINVSSNNSKNTNLRHILLTGTNHSMYCSFTISEDVQFEEINHSTFLMFQKVYRKINEKTIFLVYFGPEKVNYKQYR